MVAEAMAMGRGVIASATGSYYMETVTGGAPIQLVRRGSVAELARAMVEYKPPDPVVLAAHAASRHSPSSHVDAWLAAMDRREGHPHPSIP
jgi:glycosyltransferase involved in cell wall biosynthesis